MIEILFSDPVLYFMMASSIVIAFSMHEYAHAQAADFLGDETPKATGRLTINPLAHFDFLGALLIFTMGFGWGKPVMFNPLNFKNRKWGVFLVGLVGPLTNISMGLAVGLFLRFSNLTNPGLINFLGVFTLLNFGLGFFNLIPLPPLDGSHLLFTFLPARFENMQRFIFQYSLLFLLALIFLIPVIPYILSHGSYFLFNLIIGGKY